jgi:hypothetical protein
LTQHGRHAGQRLRFLGDGGSSPTSPTCSRCGGGIAVGTGVLPIQVQHPMQLAQCALTVNLISGEWLVLGSG